MAEAVYAFGYRLDVEYSGDVLHVDIVRPTRGNKKFSLRRGEEVVEEALMPRPINFDEMKRLLDHAVGFRLSRGTDTPEGQAAYDSALSELKPYTDCVIARAADAFRDGDPDLASCWIRGLVSQSFDEGLVSGRKPFIQAACST